MHERINKTVGAYKDAATVLRWNAELCIQKGDLQNRIEDGPKEESRRFLTERRPSPMEALVRGDLRQGS